jgi:hypothetical protein
MDNTNELAWYGFQTNLGKYNLLKKYFPKYDKGKKPTEDEIVYIYKCEHK